MIHLTVATHNYGKLNEMLAELLTEGASKVDAWALPDNVPEAPETGVTFLENARQKAAFYSTLVSGLILAEDSGLGLNTEHGWPGVNSKRIGETDEERNSLILARLHGKVGYQDRGATFFSAVAIARMGQVLYSTQATTTGTILYAPKGEGGFGFDPVFAVRGSDLGLGPGWRSLSELGSMKRVVSPRVRSLGETGRWLARYERDRFRLPWSKRLPDNT